ncbi:Werner Syndrome-like exonuclease [Ananas comosus]|uniref:Werner Syndrome-like exonuclease n=1 Tax=Ananas comosus TaxID=4615 RepID=A0A6P5FZL6_ANACO|nr:Werner Syndrome-like exonuclease [Ananas comosus]
MSAESRLVGTTHIVTFPGLAFASPRGIFTTATRSAAMVANWVDRIIVAYGTRGPLNPQVVGLIVMSQPELHVSDNYPIALLQLCVGSDCLIYQLLHRDAAHPPELENFFKDPRFCFVGDAVNEHADRLLSEQGLLVRNTVDLADAVAERLRRPELRSARLDRLMREVMGAEIEMPEDVRLSSWQQRVLQPHQVAYACADAFISYQIGMVSFLVL